MTSKLTGREDASLPWWVQATGVYQHKQGPDTAMLAVHAWIHASQRWWQEGQQNKPKKWNWSMCLILSSNWKKAENFGIFKLKVVVSHEFNNNSKYYDSTLHQNATAERWIFQGWQYLLDQALQNWWHPGPSPKYLEEIPLKKYQN